MTNNEKTRIDEVDAKGGKRVTGMTTVLAVSIGAAVVAMLAALAIFGL